MDDDLALLRSLADAVQRALRGASRDAFGKRMGLGADGTSTKMVDDLAERAILDALAESGAHLDVLSEEMGHRGTGADRTLVVDPIDGTTNAVRGVPFYCVSLAIGRKSLSDVETGVVVNLATGDRFEAVQGGGASFNGVPIAVRPPTPDDEEAFLVSTAASGARRGAFPPRTILRNLGACALEMSLVAQGALDAYHYPKPILRVIDVAASVLIVREAGGVVLDEHGKDLDLPLSLAPRFPLTAASTRDLALALGGAA